MNCNEAKPLIHAYTDGELLRTGALGGATSIAARSRR